MLLGLSETGDRSEVRSILHPVEEVLQPTARMQLFALGIADSEDCCQRGDPRWRPWRKARCAASSQICLFMLFSLKSL